MVNSLVVKGFKNGTKNFASLYVEMLKADKIFRNSEQFSMLASCNLPYINRS